METQFSTSCPKLLSMDVFSPCLSADIPSWPAFLCGLSSHPDILALGSRGSPVLRWTPTTLGHTCLSGTNVSRKGSKEKRKTAVGLLVSRNLWHFVFDYPCVLISLALLLFCGGIYGLCYASCSVAQGQPKGKAEIPVVTRECRRNSRKTTWFPLHRKMRPLPLQRLKRSLTFHLEVRYNTWHL